MPKPIQRPRWIVQQLDSGQNQLTGRILRHRFEPRPRRVCIATDQLEFGQNLPLGQLHPCHLKRLRQPQGRLCHLERRTELTEHFLGDAGVIQKHQALRGIIVQQFQTVLHVLERRCGLFDQQQSACQLEPHRTLQRHMTGRLRQPQRLFERRLCLHAIGFKRGEPRDALQDPRLADHVFAGAKRGQGRRVVVFDLIVILALEGAGGQRRVQVAAQRLLHIAAQCLMYRVLEASVQDRDRLVGPSKSQQGIAHLKPHLRGGVCCQVPIQQRPDPLEHNRKLAPIKLEFGLCELRPHHHIGIKRCPGHLEHLAHAPRPFGPVVHGTAEFRTAPMHLKRLGSVQVLEGAGVTTQGIFVRENRFGGTGRLEPPSRRQMRFEGVLPMIGDAFRCGPQLLEAARDAPMQQPGAFRI